MPTWVTCKEYPDFEIKTVYPHKIRNKETKEILNEFKDSTTYWCVSLNGETVKKHRLIAVQFLPNPKHLPVVDHKNRNRHDNRVCNLRWVSYSDNNFNKSNNHKANGYP